jgi:rare lipoprotein A
MSRALALPLCVIALGLGACFSAPPRSEIPSAAPLPPAPAERPPPPDTVPDVVPRNEPRSRNGNPPFYDVMGKRYFVLSSGVGYVERGVASWYGPGFHKVRTSTGEPYDMYGMTAAHKTLPLPAYVRVTNLQNGRSIVVRVNDRGPFVGNRIIDLSYTAAAKLDMLRNGTAMVEVRSLEPSSESTPLTAPTVAPLSTSPITAAAEARPPISPAPISPAPSTSPPPEAVSDAGSAASTVPVPRALFIQAGAFSDPQNAARLTQKLRGGGYGNVFVRDNQIAGRRMYRVRIGPVPSVAEFDRIVAALERVGIDDAHLALD